MTDPAVTAKQLVDLSRKHIEDAAVPHRFGSANSWQSTSQTKDAARLSAARRVLEKTENGSPK